ncbi:response regulator [Sulfurospirillum arcachonense]|uniref:response regulator n=1 Tax=Sulfurospirillum arcachonense TaxID=57666 RepID=UPI000469F144|nr:response regulator [Sulfurospirillum arcachonense]
MNDQIKILAVDDDFINLKLIHSMLKKNKNIRDVVEAANGLEALNILKEHSDINLILLDIKMPIMDGIEFLNNLASMANSNKIPVIVLTTDETRKHEAFDNGAFDFLVKPIREAELTKKIDKVVELI